MSEAEKSFTPEGEPKSERYSLDRVTIKAITTLPEMQGKVKNFAWPLELQGEGKTNEKDKTMLVRFPVGDIFLSFVTTIHELGHLRQEELNPALKQKHQTHKNLLAQEQDAWTRGLERFQKANPDILAALGKKFQEYRAQGKLDFDSFQGLYAFVRENTLSMVETQHLLFEESGKETGVPNEERFNKLAGELKKAGIQKFLKRYIAAHVGETVNEEEIRTAIKKTIELIINE